MFTKFISYIIAYYSQDSQSYIAIIIHGSNWLWIIGNSDRQPTLRSGKNCFILIFLNKILWQVFCHGHIIFLLSAWWMENNFINWAFFYWRYFKWLLGVRSWYCNNIPLLWICVDTIQRTFSALVESDSLSQKSGCPYFCDFFRNFSIKNHIFYKRIARHSQKFLYSLYIHFVIPFIELISFFGWQIILVSASSLSWCGFRKR